MQNTFSSGATGILGECLDSFRTAYTATVSTFQAEAKQLADFEAEEKAAREEEESRAYYECRPVCDADLGWGGCAYERN